MQIVLVMVIGGLAGFIYWKVFGCAFGICSLSRNKYMSTLIGALLGLMIFTSSSCSAQTHEEHRTDTVLQTSVINENVSPEIFSAKIGNENTILIDVRTPDEFAEGHIPSAINLNYNSTDFDDELDKLDKTKIYLVYCRSGARSVNAATMMSERNFTTIYTLKGGILGWNAPLVK